MAERQSQQHHHRGLDHGGFPSWDCRSLLQEHFPHVVLSVRHVLHHSSSAQLSVAQQLSLLNLNQLELNSLSVAKDIGKAFGLLAGLASDKLPTWLILLIGPVEGLVGYGAQWLVVSERIKSLSYWQMCIFLCMGGNSDDVLSRAELRKAFVSLRLIEAHFGIDVTTPPDQLTQLYESIFNKFDTDQSGTVDLEEFREEMKKIMRAIADGLGSSPIQMVLEDDEQNFLKKAADLEASKTSL